MTADVRWTDDHCHVHYRGAPADQVTAVVEAARDAGVTPVSYTHLTLPTSDLV